MTVDQKAQVANAREEKPMSSRNDEQNSAEVNQPAELHTPAEWCALAAVEVLDPDGWRGRDGRDWTDPISQAEFQERLTTCTQRSIAAKPVGQATADDYVRATALAVGVDPDEAVAYRRATDRTAGEQHTGTLNLTGDGNAPASPISDEIVQLAERAYEAFSAGMQDALDAAYPAIRQQVAEEIAAAIAVSRSRITPGRPGWDYLSEAIDITKRVGGVA